MQALTRVTGTATPLQRSDVDTDQIIPSDWLKRVERTGFGQGLFSEWRENPDFVLNDPRYAGAKVLIAGSNFGTGSSREHAVWALSDYGFVAAISPRFGDIFRNNASKNGFLPVTVSDEVGAKLMSAVLSDPTVEIEIDVESLRVKCAAIGVDEPFPMDEFTQYRFLNGLDDIGITMQKSDAITDYEAHRPAHKPTSV